MMGPATNPIAVADHELRVHGLFGLRVADASTIPTVASVNTNAGLHHDRREMRGDDARGGVSITPSFIRTLGLNE
jgi:GMC oxidoreductase